MEEGERGERVGICEWVGEHARDGERETDREPDGAER